MGKPENKNYSFQDGKVTIKAELPQARQPQDRTMSLGELHLHKDQLKERIAGLKNAVAEQEAELAKVNQIIKEFPQEEE
jgi:hypothetical protein